MTVLFALLIVAMISWLYRICFTALVDSDRLPTAVRERMDAVAPAAFAALVAAKIGDTPPQDLLPVAAALLAAGIAAWRGASHILAIGVAAVAWSLAAAL